MKRYRLLMNIVIKDQYLQLNELLNRKDDWIFELDTLSPDFCFRLIKTRD